MEERIIRLEESQKRLEDGQNRLEEKTNNMEQDIHQLKNDVSFLRDEVRIGFNTLNETLNAMFNITASSVKANKEVATIMETAYGDASAKYAEIKAKPK